MELKKRLDFRLVLVVIYFVAFGIYVFFGLQPVGAKKYEISASLQVPSINLNSAVTALELEGRELKTPEYIVGSYTRSENKILLLGHSSTVFKNLDQIKLSEEINYDGLNYKIVEIELIEKSKIKMGELLKSAEKKTLILMTCAGEDLGGGDATHRLIITAEAE
ncbi:sortase [Candidatus Saccharibacteria bacterium]|nr:sortase [Candidatus Saccharibacteria bacterium]